MCPCRIYYHLVLLIPLQLGENATLVHMHSARDFLKMAVHTEVTTRSTTLDVRPPLGTHLGVASICLAIMRSSQMLT